MDLQLDYIYPTLSKLYSINNKEKLAESVAASVNYVNLVVSPATVGAIVYYLLVKLLKVEEIDMLINMVKKKLKKS